MRCHRHLRDNLYNPRGYCPTMEVYLISWTVTKRIVAFCTILKVSARIYHRAMARPIITWGNKNITFVRSEKHCWTLIGLLQEYGITYRMYISLGIHLQTRAWSNSDYENHKMRWLGSQCLPMAIPSYRPASSSSILKGSVKRSLSTSMVCGAPISKRVHELITKES